MENGHIFLAERFQLLSVEGVWEVNTPHLNTRVTVTGKGH